MLVFDSWLTLIISVCVCVTKQRLYHICHCILLKCQSLLLKNCKGHVNPLLHEGSLTNVFVSNGDFFGGATWDVTVSWTDSCWHCARPQSQPEVLYRPAAFWTYYLKFFLISRIYWAYCVHFCLGVTESLGWDIYSSAGAEVFQSSVSNHLFSAPLRQKALTQVNHQQSPLIWLTSLSQWGH